MYNNSEVWLDIKFLTRIKAGKIIPILEKILSSRLEEVILNTL